MSESDVRTTQEALEAIYEQVCKEYERGLLPVDDLGTMPIEAKVIREYAERLIRRKGIALIDYLVTAKRSEDVKELGIEWCFGTVGSGYNRVSGVTRVVSYLIQCNGGTYLYLVQDGDTILIKELRARGGEYRSVDFKKDIDNLFRKFGLNT